MGSFSIEPSRGLAPEGGLPFIPQQRGQANTFGELRVIGRDLQTLGAETAQLITGMAAKSRQMQDAQASSETALILESAEDTLKIARANEPDPTKWASPVSNTFQAARTAIAELPMSEQRRGLIGNTVDLAESKAVTTTTLAAIQKQKDDTLYSLTNELVLAHTSGNEGRIEAAELNYSTGLEGILTEKEMSEERSKAVSQGQKQWVNNTKEALSLLPPDQAAEQIRVLQSQGLVDQGDVEEVIQNAKFNQEQTEDEKQRAKQSASAEENLRKSELIETGSARSNNMADDPIGVEVLLPKTLVLKWQSDMSRLGQVVLGDDKPPELTREIGKMLDVYSGDVGEVADIKKRLSFIKKPQNPNDLQASFVEAAWGDREITRDQYDALKEASKKLSAFTPEQINALKDARVKIKDAANAGITPHLSDDEERAANEATFGLIDYIANNTTIGRFTVQGSQPGIDEWVDLNAASFNPLSTLPQPDFQGQQMTAEQAQLYVDMLGIETGENAAVRQGFKVSK